VLEEIERSIDPNAAIAQNKDLVKNDPRTIGERDRIHYTVAPRDGHNNPRPNAPRETPEDEAQRVAL
jgi:hypothetical protein